MRKTTTLFAALFLGSALQAQICSPFPPDPSATELGFNPNPIPEAVTGTNYNHQNTVVLPGQVDNTLTQTPGDSIALCGIKILSVSLDTAASYNQNIPANFNFDWEVWQDAQSPAITPANSQNTPIDIAPNTTFKRVCLRLTSTNVPTPINNPCDTVYFKVDVRGRIDPLGLGTCNDVPGTDGVLSFNIAMPVCATSSVENFGEGNGLQLLPLQPNPAHNYTELPIYAPSAGMAQIAITDALGRVVFEQAYAVQAGTQRLSIPTSTLSNGIYGLSLNLNGTQVVDKLMVQH